MLIQILTVIAVIGQYHTDSSPISCALVLNQVSQTAEVCIKKLNYVYF